MKSLALTTLLIVSVHAFADAPPKTYMEMAANYSEAMDGTAMLVMHRGSVIFEYYSNGGAADKPHYLASGTKSFTGVMAAAAVQDGLLSLDEPVSKTIIEWQSDPQRSAITIRQLLSLTSGLDAGNNGRPPTYEEAIQSKSVAPPGTMFRYGPVAFQVFGEIMKRKLAAKGEDPLEYLTRRVLTPIGMNIGRWRHDRNRDPHWPSGAFLTAREWAKFGEFVRLGGKLNDKPLVDSVSLESCFKGSAVNPMYGLSFWLPNHANEPGAQTPRARWTGVVEIEVDADTPEIFMAAGAGNQRLYIIRSLELVVVRQGDMDRYSDGDFLRRLLKGETE